VGVLIDGLLSDPYWTRAWVFQAIAFGRRVRFLCGEKSVTLRDIWDAMTCWDRHVQNGEVLEWIRLNRAHGEVSGYRELPGQVSDRDFDKVWDSPLCRMLREIAFISHSSEPLIKEWPASRSAAKLQQIYQLSLSTLAGFSNLHATDERDKVFALWSFIDTSASESDLLLPEYGLSAREAFTWVAVYIKQPQLFHWRSLTIVAASVATVALALLALDSCSSAKF
jgi:hypothetical protein